MILLLGRPGAKSKASVQSQGNIPFSSLCEGVGWGGLHLSAKQFSRTHVDA